MKKFQSKTHIARYSLLMISMVGVFACGNGGDAGAAAAMPGSTPANSAVEGDMMTLAVKFVNFSKDGKPVINDQQVQKVVTEMNQLYTQCKVQFKAEEVVAADPGQYGLDYVITSNGDMEKIRAPFDTDKALVVINTGPWSHGSMGSANAWTSMPGTNPSGAVLESEVADNANIAGHELGHYLGLDHASDKANLMNPVIYPTSSELSAAQCEDVRRVASTDRVGALR